MKEVQDLRLSLGPRDVDGVGLDWDEVPALDEHLEVGGEFVCDCE
jgi:hypothetical protein